MAILTRTTSSNRIDIIGNTVHNEQQRNSSSIIKKGMATAMAKNQQPTSGDCNAMTEQQQVHGVGKIMVQCVLAR